MPSLLGIDPGQKGAIALLSMPDRELQTFAMPGTTRELHETLASMPKVSHCTIEKPFYPKHIGTAKVARIAEAYGVIKGALQWLDIPVHEVRPADWKRSLNIPADKNAARQRASEFFPAAADQWPLVKDDGKAEAALIAWFGMKWL